MATWKQVVFSDDVPNLGGSNLTQTSADRVFSLKQRDGDPTKKNLRFIAETTLGATSSLVDIETKDYQADGSGDADGGRFTVNTQNISLNASNVTHIGAAGFHATASEVKFQTPILQIWNTQDDGLVNPLLRLRRNSASPADGDLLGEIAFNGKDDDGNYLDYATITASIVDATNDTEDGALDIKLKTAGSSLSALKIAPEPSASELSAGSATSPVFYSDNIDLYGKSLRQRLLNEIGVTTPFSCIFYPTLSGSSAGIEKNHEVWGIASQESFSTFPFGSQPHQKSVRNLTAMTSTVGATVEHSASGPAFDLSSDQPSDLGGASWIVCHHNQGVTPSISSGTGRVYDFNGTFFYKPSNYTSDSDTLDNDQTGAIRIYQVVTTGGVLVTTADGGSSKYSLKLMAKKDISFLNTVELTTNVFNFSFNSDHNLSTGHDIFVVTFTNTGTQTLGSNDDSDDFSQYSVPFIKGEVTRRIANVNDT